MYLEDPSNRMRLSWEAEGVENRKERSCQQLRMPTELSRKREMGGEKERREGEAGGSL